MFNVRFALSLFLGLAATAGAQGLNGTNVSVGYAFPNATTFLAGPTTYTVGSGLEINCPTGATGFCSATSLSEPFSLDISNNQITFTQGPLPTATSYLVGPFNGWVFTNLNAGAPITGVNITSTGISNLTNSNVSFTANSISVNMLGSTVQQSSSWTLTITYGSTAPATPVPPSVVLAIVGIAFLAVFWHFTQRRQHQA